MVLKVEKRAFESVDIPMVFAYNPALCVGP
jgi:hypothetical protein